MPLKEERATYLDELRGPEPQLSLAPKSTNLVTDIPDIPDIPDITDVTDFADTITPKPECRIALRNRVWRRHQVDLVGIRPETTEDLDRHYSPHTPHQTTTTGS